jgi:hypothetical protein
VTTTLLFATRDQVEQLADLLEQIIQLQGRLVEVVERLIPPAEASPDSGETSRPGLRLVE